MGWIILMILIVCIFCAWLTESGLPIAAAVSVCFILLINSCETKVPKALFEEGDIVVMKLDTTLKGIVKDVNCPFLIGEPINDSVKPQDLLCTYLVRFADGKESSFDEYEIKDHKPLRSSKSMKEEVHESYVESITKTEETIEIPSSTFDPNRENPFVRK